MQHITSLDGFQAERTWLTIGVFDGVHRGHQAIIDRLVAGARREGCAAAVLTFHPHPAVVLGGRELMCLTTPDERAAQLGALGVDLVITHPFDAQVAATPDLDFMQRLSRQLGLSRLLIGYDFALGRGRSGNALRLAEIGQTLGYAVEVIPAVSDESGVISSTEIRKLVSIGSMPEAAKLLGRPYGLSGAVIHGAGRGRGIGIPTANIDYARGKLLPPRGIYACWAWLGSERLRAAVNIGVNPTFTPDRQDATVEAYLLDFTGDLYGQTLRLEFAARLRDEMRFTSVSSLLSQIEADVKQARAILV